MANDSIQSLVIEHLRGSTTPFSLSFEKNKKLSIIYGENGTGKSTICDALDFLGKGNIGSLDNKGLGKTSKYWHSIGRTPNDVSVILRTSDGSCKATLAKAGVVVEPIELRPRVEVLRRSQILNLVEAKPADRYSAISKFIDISGVEASEAALRQLIHSIEKDQEVAVARVQENGETIARFWEQAGSLGPTALEWAAKEVEKDQSAFNAEKTAIESLRSAYDKLQSYPRQYKTQLNNRDVAIQELNTAETTVNVLNKKVAGEYLEIFEILQAAQRHFTTYPNPAICPLCESKENVANLPEMVKRRIASQGIANHLKSANLNLKKKQQALAGQNASLEALKARALSDVENLVQITQSAKLPRDIELPDLPCPSDMAGWENWLAQAPQLLERWGKIADGFAESRKFNGALKASLEALRNNSHIQRELDEVLPRLRDALTIVEDERRKLTDSILQKIAEEVGKLYETVHPGEGLNKISLELDPAKRASLEIAAEFQGLNGTPPQAYFSDSHLDTLGLCVFLALAQMDNPEEIILVLDDVLGSVDEPHVDRLIEMLYLETMKFQQCVITTHYKPWRQKLRWGWLKNGQCQFIELTKWTSTTGISLVRSVPDVERLRTLLAETPPDPQLVTAKAGIILEAALDFLTLLYECRVPRRADSLYTLGELLPAVDNKLRNALRVEHKQDNADGTFSYIDKQLAPCLNELSRIAQARNVFGCHFNALSFDLLDSDAVSFGVEVLALMDCLIDHEVGWPRNDKSGSYWATAGETRRLYPLKKPR
jgi:energy-coupling factor transporter ATP-binding protein EcfA2